MSGGDKNKKKAPHSQGWEEAGAEFYQESYPSNDVDFEVLQRDPKHLATLLPSKQSRAATFKRIRGTDNTRTFRRQTSSRSRQESFTRRTSTLGDVQVSMLPDLSENLSNEQSTWEEIMRIKALPVPMAEKREMKLKLQSEPNLRLQGYEQFKWKRRKILDKFRSNVKEKYSKLELWKGEMKKIEGNFGTGVVAYFLFIKWLMVLNFCIFLLIFLFIILPTILFNYEEELTCTGELNSTQCCSAQYYNQSFSSDSFFLSLVQGRGWMEKTVMFYGYYSDRTFEYFINSTPMYYNLPFSYVCMLLVMFLISLFAIIKAAAKGFKERLIEGEGQFYQYCNLVFNGWDFCIDNEKTAAIKHKAIYNEIKGLLENERIQEEKQNRTREEKTKLYILRFIINLIVLVVLASCGIAVYFVFEFSQNILKQFDSSENNSYLLGNLKELFYEYLPSLCIVLFNLLVPFSFRYLVTLEKYSPLFVIRITLIRTIFLRLMSLGILLASLYLRVNCELKDDVCYSSQCTPQCWETYAGQQFFKLIITDFATHIIITFLLNFPRSIIAQSSNSKVAKFIGEQHFELPKHVLDVIYIQTLVWLGSFYAPILSAMATILLFFMFYIKKFACLINSVPGNIIYHASRSNSMFMIILLGGYTFALIPIFYAISEVLPSKSCGPFRGLNTVWSKVINTFNLTPSWVQNIVYFISTAGFAIPAFLFLILLLYYYWAINSANRHMVSVLKNQLMLEGHDKQFLLDRLSMFIRQQQESQRKMRHTEIMRASGGDRNVASN
ncbi:transmembrane channel-like protein 7 isoform X1 [Agrilus planipennis]|uniref:Transmembrane channel-like protein 7 isoform X1 n=1 Tax=Agrilus planipennis TaxID=224129 RepID=A0A1W4XIW2_AGRPL|nr:transmembrane channel-like protein 7 isoform X1 [Agrilus planipennis]